MTLTTNAERILALAAIVSAANESPRMLATGKRFVMDRYIDTMLGMSLEDKDTALVELMEKGLMSINGPEGTVK